MRLLRLLKLFKTKSQGRFIASNVLRLGCLALVVSASRALAQPSEIPHYGSVRVGDGCICN
jgi:hypothetical protein